MGERSSEGTICFQLFSTTLSDPDAHFVHTEPLHRRGFIVREQSMIRVGDEAPDFEIPVNTGEMFRLHDQREISNVVLYFYPADFTLGCTKEACSFQDHFSALRQAEAVVVGISPDDIDTHKRFARAYGLGFLLASDPKLRVCKQYGALWLGGIRVKRITVVIDKNGIVRGVIHLELKWKQHSVDVLQLLKTLS